MTSSKEFSDKFWDPTSQLPVLKRNSSRFLTKSWRQQSCSSQEQSRILSSLLQPKNSTISSTSESSPKSLRVCFDPSPNFTKLPTVWSVSGCTKSSESSRTDSSIPKTWLFSGQFWRTLSPKLLEISTKKTILSSNQSYSPLSWQESSTPLAMISSKWEEPWKKNLTNITMSRLKWTSSCSTRLSSTFAGLLGWQNSPLATPCLSVSVVQDNSL